MRAVVDLAQALAVDVAVDLRRRERRVAEQLLDRPQVGAAFEQVRRERVAQAVRMRRDPPERARVEAPAAHGEEERVLGSGRELRAGRARGSARATSPPPRRAGRRAPCRPCRARARAPARSRRRRDRGRPPRRCAARPSRRARRAPGSAARAGRRPRARRASGRSRRLAAGPAGGADRLGRAQRRERARARAPRAGTSARPRAGARCSRARGARVRGRARPRTRSARDVPTSSRRSFRASSQRAKCSRSTRYDRRVASANLALLEEAVDLVVEAPQAVIRAAAHSSSRSSDHITKSTRLSRRAL